MFFKKYQDRFSDPFFRFCYGLIRTYSKNGKRLRPIGTMLSYFASGKIDKKIILPALSIELLQSHSLILDDIMDEDEFRRGKKTIYQSMKEYFIENYGEESYEGSLFSKKSNKYATSFGMMLGNIVLILSELAVIDSEFPDSYKIKALRAINLADEIIYHGQMKDIDMETHQNITETDYLMMIERKTSVFFGMALQIGSILAGDDESKSNLYYEFGKTAALSFQIQDDIIDIVGKKGHQVGSDIRKGKRTLLYIKSLELSNEYQKKDLIKYYGKNHDETVKRIIQIMQDTGSINYCKKLANLKNNKAKKILEKINMSNEHKIIFRDMTDFMLNRSA